MGFNGIYGGIPSGKRLQFGIENDPVEIADFPSYKMVIFHSYVSLPESK